MKISTIILTAVVTANLFTAAAFAVPTDSKPSVPNATAQEKVDITEDKDPHIKHGRCNKENCKDPVKALENKRETIIKLEKEGKISKEEADRKITKIDERIKVVQEFNNLPVEQKRVKLVGKFKEVMALKVKEGKLTQDMADEMISEYTKKIQNWDGNGMPKFLS